MLDVSDCDSHWRVVSIEPAKTGNFVEQWRKRFGSFQELPEKTRFAVASLRMCEDQGRIQGVGQKVSEKTFWVDAAPEILEEYDDKPK